MALVLRPTTDLVSLYDNGLIGEEGGTSGLPFLVPSALYSSILIMKTAKSLRVALRALIQVTRPIHRLDLSHNLLGDGGVGTLVQGLTSCRGRYSSPEMGIWGLEEINLIHNEIGDAGLDAVLGYAKKDVWLRRAYLQDNRITVCRLNDLRWQ